MKGIDISEFQGIIDFEKVKKAGIEFVMIRASYGRKKEDKFLKKNVEGCIKNNIPFGFYYYSYAVDEATAIEEVDFFLKTISPYKEAIRFPLVIDMEDSDGYKKERNAISKENITKICKLAIDKIQGKGFIGMIYASLDWFKNYIDEKEVEKIPKWLAWWNEKAEFDKQKYSIWQYTSSGKVDGIGTKVDMNESYVEYNKYIEYLNNVIKIQEIKLQTGINDLDLQYMSCYKWGQDLINKIYKRIQNPKRIEDKEKDLHNVVQTEYELEDKTITYLSYYVYSEQVFLKLYKVICIKEMEKND